MATRLLDKTYMKSKGQVYIYISTNGDDATANGTEQKPFATVQKAILYAYNNVYANHHIRLKFLTDHTTNVITSVGHIPNGQFFIFDANGHNVTLTRLKLSLGNFSFEGINFKQTDPTQEIINVYDGALCYILGDSTIEIMANAQQDIIQSWGARVLIDHRSNITFTSKGVPKNIFLFLATYQGFNLIHSTARVTLDANLTHIGFSKTHINSCMFVDKKATITAPPRPQAYGYQVAYGAHFSTHGRGKLPNLGDLTSVDQSSSIS